MREEFKFEIRSTKHEENSKHLISDAGPSQVRTLVLRILGLSHLKGMVLVERGGMREGEGGQGGGVLRPDLPNHPPVVRSFGGPRLQGDGLQLHEDAHLLLYGKPGHTDAVFPLARL
jgi:hypothetical protein